jgi:hypothetical protein
MKDAMKVSLLVLAVLIFSAALFAEEPAFMSEVKDPNLRMSLRTYGKTNLTQLVNLVLNANRITDIRPLKNMTQLTRLELYNNSISDISSLSNLVNLTKLYLGKNRIKDISPLRYLKNLAVLDIHKNDIKDISPLSNLTGLKELDIRSLGVNLDSFAGWKFENSLQIYDEKGQFVEIATNEKEKWGIHFGIVEPAAVKNPQAEIGGTNGMPNLFITNTNK